MTLVRKPGGHDRVP